LFRERRDARFLLEIRSRTTTNGVDMRKPVAVLTRILLTSTVVAAITGCSQSGKASDTAVAVEARPSVPVEAVNGTNFHLLDFVAWNNRDMDMFRRLHTADVKVDMMGVTEGIDAHVAAVQPMLSGPSAGRIVQHWPIVAQGEWTCMVGTIMPGNAKMVTAAKWRDGAVSEEYILMKLLKPGSPRPALSGLPMMNISNQNGDLKRQIGAEPGWSCLLDRSADGKTMTIILDKTGGTATDEMIFTK